MGMIVCYSQGRVGRKIDIIAEEIPAIVIGAAMNISEGHSILL